MTTLSKKIAIGLLAVLATTQAQAFVYVRIAPPPIPYYEQPLLPDDGYIWTPGYWAWDDGDQDYYWVPGTWVLAPEPGFLWTPGYWGWENAGYYGWHAGYWGPHVGYYGGINYGYGYYGRGYAGGRWYGNRFSYNRAVNNVNVVVIHNTYNTPVRESGNRVSYNGGSGGLHAQPRPDEQRAERERHIEHTDLQLTHETEARHDRSQFASVNQGRPAIAATSRPGDFHAAGEGLGGHEDYRRMTSRVKRAMVSGHVREGSNDNGQRDLSQSGQGQATASMPQIVDRQTRMQHFDRSQRHQSRFEQRSTGGGNSGAPAMQPMTAPQSAHFDRPPSTPQGGRPMGNPHMGAAAAGPAMHAPTPRAGPAQGNRQPHQQQ